MPETALELKRFAGLEAWLRHALEAERATLSKIERLPGGAIQENWLLELDVAGGRWNGARRWVLRTGSATGLSISHGRAHEFAILNAARQAGVLAPEPILLCEDRAILGDGFMIVGWAPGTAQGRRIARDPDLEKFGRSLARALGGQLARLHAIAPPRSDLAFLGAPPVDPAKARIAEYRDSLDQMKEARPVLEYALNWLEDRAPAPNQVRLCHADFRTGNYLVHDGELTAILDWEFARWSDPGEDIGWFCARCWRFGRQVDEAGGIADRKDFYSGYEAGAGRPIDRARIGFWEVMAHVRWSVIALLQEHRHLSGEKPVLELALTGQMIPEIENDLLAEMSAQTGRA